MDQNKKKPLVIVVANQKGGVGKSTVCQNLAHCLSAQNIKTCIIDLDPQGNTSKSFPIPESDEILKIFDGANAKPSQIENTNLSLIPSHPSLAIIASKMVNDYDTMFKLRDYTEKLDSVDIIVIDTPPTIFGLTISALTAADYLLIPISTSFYSLHGINDLLDTFKKVKARLNPTLKMLGVCISIFDKRNAVSAQVKEDLETSFNGQIFNMVIPRTIKIEEAQFKRQSVCELFPSSEVSVAYHSLTKEILDRLSKSRELEEVHK